MHYVGYPYVWGGTSPTAEADFGVPAAGGFDCSGFVWRVYKLTSYPGEGSLAGTLRGRTTYVMSGEVPRAERIPHGESAAGGRLFFGDKGPRSTPDEVDHTGALPRRRLVHPVLRRGRDGAPVRRLVCREFRVGAPAAARSRPGVVPPGGQPPSVPYRVARMLAPGISTDLARFAIGFDHRDRARLHELWDRILDENRWSEGELTREFEERWAAWNGLGAVAFNGWTGAALAALDWAGVRGETVLCPSNTFMATPLAAIQRRRARRVRRLQPRRPLHVVRRPRAQGRTSTSRAPCSSCTSAAISPSRSSGSPSSARPRGSS